MEFILLLFCLFVCVQISLVASHAAHQTSEDYWKSVLPNTTMPKAITDNLDPDGMELKSLSVDVNTPGGVYANPKQFFYKKNLHQGTKLNFQFTSSNSAVKFLPRHVAQSLPFSSKKLPEIFNRFSVKPDSMEAKVMKRTISECEEPGTKGEEKYCVTSLESMVDFSISKVGKKVHAISTVLSKETGLEQEYNIAKVKEIVAGKSFVSCHKANWAPYAVFLCHIYTDARAYISSLVGEIDGTKAEAVTLCHEDTTALSEEFMDLVLHDKPGSDPFCHFLPEDDLIWVPYSLHESVI